MSCRTAAQLVAGCIQQTREANGKLLLTRALKVAHNTMTNYQLVAQVCSFYPSQYTLHFGDTPHLFTLKPSLKEGGMGASTLHADMGIYVC